jgi:hypothetical protein
VSQIKIKTVISNGPWPHPSGPRSDNRDDAGETCPGPSAVRPVRSPTRKYVIAAP